MHPTLSAVPLRVIETRKNRVLVYEDRVQKSFKRAAWRATRRAKREVAALRRLAGVEGVPAILEQSPDGMSIVVSRVPGRPMSECEQVEEGTIVSLRRLVDSMLRRGVARHSLPERDIFVHPDGSAGLVDFERSTRRLFALEPYWLLSRVIMRFHLLRLVHEHAPQLLSEQERRALRWQMVAWAALQGPLRVKRRSVRRVRALWAPAPEKKPGESVIPR